MAAAGPDEANEWKSDATADRVEDARPSSAPCHLCQYWRTAKHASAGTGKRREKEGNNSPPPPLPHALSPSMALEEKRLRPENSEQGNCKLALCAFAQGLTGDKSLDRRESLIFLLIPFHDWNLIIERN